MPVTLKQSEELSSLCLEGAIDIASAVELKTLLQQALASGKSVQVSFEEATDLDVTTVQLLWAAGRQAKGSGTAFTYAEPVPEEIARALVDAGLELCRS